MADSLKDFFTPEYHAAYVKLLRLSAITDNPESLLTDEERAALSPPPLPDERCDNCGGKVQAVFRDGTKRGICESCGEQAWFELTPELQAEVLKRMSSKATRKLRKRLMRR